MSNLLSKRNSYKPFAYPWAYEAAQRQMGIHWIKEEVPLAEDVKDWQYNLDDNERNLLTHIFRFFTQADIDVAHGYIYKFMPLFAGHPEVAMMLTQFAAMEGIHIDAYSNLLETVGMEETEYNAFLEYKAMVDKHEYISGANLDAELMSDVYDYGSADYNKVVAKSLAVYAAFTEGLQLFSSFAILLNFTRFGKMKGMGTIVEFSIRDESLHVESMIKLFNTFIQENLDIWTDDFKGEIYQACRDMVDLEDTFIDLAFEQGGIQGLTADEVKQYVRYMANRRLHSLGLKPNYEGVEDHPLPWLAEMLNGVEHTNFFENRVTAYAKGTITGDWNKDVWGNMGPKDTVNG